MHVLIGEGVGMGGERRVYRLSALGALPPVLPGTAPRALIPSRVAKEEEEEEEGRGGGGEAAAPVAVALAVVGTVGAEPTTNVGWLEEKLVGETVEGPPPPIPPLPLDLKLGLRVEAEAESSSEGPAAAAPPLAVVAMAVELRGGGGEGVMVRDARALFILMVTAGPLRVLVVVVVVAGVEGCKCCRGGRRWER